MKINVVYDTGTNANGMSETPPVAVQNVVNAVVNYFDTLFTNSVTITIDFGWGEIDNTALTPGSLGDSLTNYLTGYSYQAIQTYYARSVSSVAQATSFNALPTSFSGNFDISLAEAKTFGIYTGTPVDGYVGIDSTQSYDYATSDTGAAPPAGEYDLFGIVAHEISEVMGRGTLDGTTLRSQSNSFTIMDLLHYSSPGVLDTSNAGGYISGDGGVTNLGNLNDAAANDGDAGDWASGGSNDSFNAFTDAGVNDPVSADDIQLMNLLGWTAAATPVTAAQAAEIYAINTEPRQSLIVTDTAANISAHFGIIANLGEVGGLSAINFTGTSTTLALSIAQLSQGLVALDDINGPYGIAITDTAANVSGALNGALEFLPGNGQLVSVTISDNKDPLTVSTTQLTNDADVFAAISGPYTLAVTDTAANVGATLNSLEAYAQAGHLTSVTLSDSPNAIPVSVAQILNDAGALAAVQGPFTLAVTDTAANITASLPTLEALAQKSELGTITVSDPTNAINVSQSQFMGDSGVFAAFSGSETINLQTHGTTIYTFGVPTSDHMSHFEINGQVTNFYTALNGYADLGTYEAPHTASEGLIGSTVGTTTPAANLTEDAYNDATLTANQAEIYRLYQAALGRQPDIPGLTSWTNALNTGTSIDSIASGFISSSEFQSTYGNLSNAAFVNLMYENVLGRAPDASGDAQWVNAMNAGMTQEQVLLGFSNSQENITDSLPPEAGFVSNTLDPNYVGEVYRLYQSALDRAPDSSGLQGWVDALVQGTDTEAQVAQGFINSSEFQSTYGSLSNTAFVTLLYKNVLGRAPDASGETQWVNAMNAGMTQEQVLVGFSDSQEFITNTQPALSTFMQTTGPWINTLDAGAGTNTLILGPGSSELAVSAAITANDQVYGLNQWSQLDLIGFGYANTAAAMTHMTQSGANVLFSDPSNPNVSIDFHNTTLASLTTALNNTHTPF